MPINDRTGFGFDFDKTLVLAHGDYDHYRKNVYSDGYRTESDWYYDSTNLYKAVLLPAFQNFKKHVDNLDDVYVITCRGSVDNDSKMQEIILDFFQLHDIYFPSDNLFIFSHESDAEAAAKKADIIKKIVYSNDYIYFEFHDDKPVIINDVEKLNGFNDCHIKCVLETSWQHALVEMQERIKKEEN